MKDLFSNFPRQIAQFGSGDDDPDLVELGEDAAAPPSAESFSLCSIEGLDAFSSTFGEIPKSTADDTPAEVLVAGCDNVLDKSAAIFLIVDDLADRLEAAADRVEAATEVEVLAVVEDDVCPSVDEFLE